MILLDSRAARSCPVKTQNAFDPCVPAPAAEPGLGWPGGWEVGRAFSARVLAAWTTAVPGLVDLGEGDGQSYEERARACLHSLSDGAPVVLGGWLPADSAGHRIGRVDALVRGADRRDGRPGYHPVVIKAHQIADRLRPRPVPDDAPGPAPRLLAVTPLAAPAPGGREIVPDFRLRLGRREGDFLRLAHYYRMLQAAGFAGQDALGAVIGTDALRAEPVLAWADLAADTVRTFSRSHPDGWRERSLLDRYDHEQAFRLDIARVAVAQTGDPDRDPPRLVSPIRVPECARCPWWEHCRPQLDPDDVSLRIQVGALDRREILALRSQGITTTADLAAADLDRLLPAYLPEVTHREGAEGRLQTAARRARMLAGGVDLARDTQGPIDLPAAAVEVDLDIETSAAGRIYLWGFWVRRAGEGQGHYRQFGRFAELDERGEAELAVAALGWLRGLIEGGADVAVYHYSGYEVAMVTGLARRQPHPVLDWAATYAEQHFVDLLEVVQRHFFGVAGLGLKRVARAAGFGWRDTDPGGLNSQLWFAEAVHAERPEDREAARQRVLAYNEDDVLANREVRRWLREQAGTGGGWGARELRPSRPARRSPG